MVMLHLSGSLAVEQIREQAEMIYRILCIYIHERPPVLTWGLCPLAFG